MVREAERDGSPDDAPPPMTAPATSQGAGFLLWPLGVAGLVFLAIALRRAVGAGGTDGSVEDGRDGRGINALFLRAEGVVDDCRGRREEGAPERARDLAEDLAR